MNRDKDLKVSKAREWFAVKRTKASTSYQFYEPNKNNLKSIEAIAPEGGNYEVITLVSKSALDELQTQLEETKLEVDNLNTHLKMFVLGFKSMESENKKLKDFFISVDGIFKNSLPNHILEIYRDSKTKAGIE